jgi:hypothetical protein
MLYQLFALKPGLFNLDPKCFTPLKSDLMHPSLFDNSTIGAMFKSGQKTLSPLK